MAYKELILPELGSVKLYKRRGSRSLRLSIGSDGNVRLSMPPWVSYRVGITYITAKKDWIVSHQIKQFKNLVHGQRIGKAHVLEFISLDQNNIKTRLKDNTINVYHPSHLSSNDSSVQKAAQTAVRRALKKEADSLLPQRLHALSTQKGLPYNSVHTRPLKSRWGSCNQRKDIVLNIFLLQLPWHLIDYVLLHELTHTKVLAHGPNFWTEFERHLPNAKILRKEIRTYQPNANFRENA